jgi:AAA+ superfamily predicted ATPase
LAVDAVAGQLHAGAALDHALLPDLVEIGGFQYESGCRDFVSWGEAVKAIVGDSVEPLLREIWDCIPRSVAEKFGTLANSVTGDTERVRLARAFRQLNFRFSNHNLAASLIDNLPGGTDGSGFPSVSQTALGAGSGIAGTGIHQHICMACGMPFTHGDWECEPPEDQYCNLCAETVSGPRPVWIERWSKGAEAGEKEDPPTNPQAESKPGKRRPAQRNRAATVTKSPVEDGAELKGTSHPAGPGGAAPVLAPDSIQARVVPTSEVAANSKRGQEDDILSRPVNPAERGFGKVAGMHELKKLLYEEVVSALRDPEDLKAYGLGIPNGILLFGPPGCGKTYISRQLAEEMNYFFKEIYPSEIGSTFIHETTLKIREVFDLAFQNAPAIIFIDEFESMVPARKNLGAHQQHTAEEVSEFLKQLEACADRKILLIAASNEPWKIDPAMQRTGRLDKKIYVGPPDRNARAEMLRFHLYGRRMSDIDVAVLAESLAGYSASDIKLLVDEAARLARRSRVPISEDHIRTAAKERVFPSVAPEDEQKYLTFGQRGVKASMPTYAVNNSTLPDHRPVDLVRKWGRGRPAAPDFSRNKS